MGHCSKGYQPVDEREGELRQPPKTGSNAVRRYQAVRRLGTWIRHNTYRGDDTSGFVDPDWRCSECGEQANVNVMGLYDLTNYCPNCGADMRGGEDVGFNR